MPVIFALIPIVLLLYLYRSNGWRLGMIYAFISWSLFAFLITEILSIISQLDYLHILASWYALNCMLVFLLLTKNSVKNIWIYIKSSLKYKKLHLKESLVLFPILFIAFFTLVIAMKSPPNNWNSLTYHLSRIEHWIQNKNINLYSTHIIRQLYMNPFAEIAMLQLRLLSSGDFYVNLIQWFAMVGCVIAVSLIAKEFSLNYIWQLTASLFAITIPSGITQSTSTQNDYVASFFIRSSA